ncbi:hypothetical protein SAZ10_20775 [Mesorhizobium sp. BAC0120]|uniref:hypothetical protein n=1 Tax=Mesorhizobium sp. BAC0120 TaxID=3090670 RepID=UPI00298D5917|nr:hypothetical protein [Mesorhizobium sp. BAC0120]MDW6024187.1 hypothetical protein [Mesorhizobium sp. BAC0120]
MSAQADGRAYAGNVSERWNLAAERDIGGFGVGSNFSYNVQAYRGYSTYLFNQPTILRAGYRALFNDYETDDFTGNTFRWNVVQQGPVAGLSMLFSCREVSSVVTILKFAQSPISNSR